MKIQEQMIENAIVQCIALDNPVGALTFLELHTQLKLTGSLEAQPTIDVTDEDIAFMSCEALDSTPEEEENWASWEFEKFVEPAKIITKLDFGIPDSEIKVFLYRYAIQGNSTLITYALQHGPMALDRMKFSIERNKHLALSIAGISPEKATFLADEVVEMINLMPKK